jgi:hypothetical protein
MGFDLHANRKGASIMTKAPPFPFLDDEVVLSRDGFVTSLDGKEILVPLGSRHRSSEAIVHAVPEMFSRDGDPFDQIQGLEQPEPPPPPTPVPVKMLRVKKLFESGQREFKSAWGGKPERFFFTLHPDQLVKETWPYLKSLTDRNARSFSKRSSTPSRSVRGLRLCNPLRPRIRPESAGVSACTPQAPVLRFLSARSNLRSVAQIRRSHEVRSREALSGEEASVPDLRDLLPDWQGALCAGTDLHFPDEGGASRGNLAAGASLLPLLICGPCPLRRRCLAEGFRTWEFSHNLSRTQAIEGPTIRNPAGGRTTFLVFGAPTVPWVFGVWGGSTQNERWALRDVPIPEAIELLDSTYESRVGARVDAWRELVAARTGHGRFDKRIKAILAERESVRVAFTLGGCGGPGRGRRGPAFAYAIEHRCSMTTARKRLHAAA